MGDGNIAGEIPLLSSFLYLLSWSERVRGCFDLIATVFYSQTYKSGCEAIPADRKFTPA